MLLSLNNISFTHKGALDPLFENINISFPNGWTGIVGANGAGKTTLLRIACCELEINNGSVNCPRLAIYCPQRTDSHPEDFREFLESVDHIACDIKGKLEIKSDWYDRWDTLSHGERKRAQIAVALWHEPDVLALDEPTNHIDIYAHDLLIHALKSYHGTGLLVSHDRELLDSLCSHCVFVEPPDVIMRPGNYTNSAQQARLEDQHIRNEYEQAKEEATKLRREAIRRNNEAARADSLRSKRKLSARDTDAREKIDMARISGADGKAGKLSSQMQNRVHRAESRLEEFNIKRKYETSFWLDGSKSPRNLLFSIPAGQIDLGGGRTLSFPELMMAPDDRIAITGLNGTGKSTLIKYIVDQLNLPVEKVIYIPQEIDLERSRQIMNDINQLPRQQLGTVLTIVSCLGSRPARLVGSIESSPGEIRKVLLALGVSQKPHLIIMDEPTNHLDLPAIERLEEALQDCPCGLLLVSHDFQFLSKLASTRWHLTNDMSGNVNLNVRYTFDSHN